MKILLAGGVLEVRALFQALAHANDHEITHCADGARAIIDLLRNGYDWAIIDGRAVSGGEKDVACVIRAMGSRTSMDLATPERELSSCGVEWSKDGVLQLHCRLHNVLHGNVSVRHVPPRSTEGYVFEYRAPCGKGRRRHE